MQILIPTGFLVFYLFGIIFVVERRLRKMFDKSCLVTKLAKQNLEETAPKQQYSAIA
jgi:hypothetical protein